MRSPRALPAANTLTTSNLGTARWDGSRGWPRALRAFLGRKPADLPPVYMETKIRRDLNRAWAGNRMTLGEGDRSCWAVCGGRKQ